MALLSRPDLEPRRPQSLESFTPNLTSTVYSEEYRRTQLLRHPNSDLLTVNFLTRVKPGGYECALSETVLRIRGLVSNDG